MTLKNTNASCNVSQPRVWTYLLKFDEHSSTMIRRRRLPYLNGLLFKNFLTAFIRPHLEYGQATLALHLKKHVNALLLSLYFLLTFTKLLQQTVKLIKSVLSGLRQFMPTKSPLKTIRNAFYLTLKALSICKMFRFLSWLFGHVERTSWLER